jgi:hypothetical protein
MSTQVDPYHNIDALNMPTVEFHFANNATSIATARLKGYRHLGNILDCTPKLDTKKTDHYGSYRGQRIKDKSVVNEMMLDYQVKADELSFENLLITFSGTETTAWTQAALSLTAADVLAFTALIPSVASVWYDLEVGGIQTQFLTAVALAKNPQVAVTVTNATDLVNETAHGRANGSVVVFTAGTMPAGLVAGQVYYVVTATTDTYQLSLTLGGTPALFSSDGANLKINSSLVEGTDYEVDLISGRFRLMATQAVTIYPYVTGPQVQAGDDDYYRVMIPQSNPTRSGMGKLILWDQDDRNKKIWEHYGFSCEVMIDSLSALDGQKFAEQTFTVSTTGKKGFLRIRNANLAFA